MKCEDNEDTLTSVAMSFPHVPGEAPQARNWIYNADGRSGVCSITHTPQMPRRRDVLQQARPRSTRLLRSEIGMRRVAAADRQRGVAADQEARENQQGELDRRDEGGADLADRHGDDVEHDEERCQNGDDEALGRARQRQPTRRLVDLSSIRATANDAPPPAQQDQDPDLRVARSLDGGR